MSTELRAKLVWAEKKIERLEEQIEGLEADLLYEEVQRRTAEEQARDGGGEYAGVLHDAVVDAARQIGNTYLGTLNDAQSVAEALQHGAIKLVKA